MNLTSFHAAVVAVCPLVAGVSAPNPADRSTWTVDYEGTPTEAQLTAVQGVIAGYSTGPDSGDVDAELARRVTLGVTVSMASGDTIPVQTRDEVDFRNVQGLATYGIALQGQGSSTLTTFRDANNANHSLTPAQLVELGTKVLAAVQALYAKAWALKATSPIPADYTADKYWA